MKDCQMCKRLQDENDGLRKLLKLKDDEVEQLKEECQEEIKHNALIQEATKQIKEEN